MEILPIKSLSIEDSQIFGSLNVALGKLYRLNFKVGSGIVITAPELVLKTTIEHFDFGSRDVFEQTLTLIKKEIEKIPFPEILVKEVGKNTRFFYNSEQINSANLLWQRLLQTWFDEIKSRIWRNGFYKGITEGLEPQVVIFANNVKVFGKAFFDPIADDTVLEVHGKLHPSDLKKLDQIVKEANKKLFIPHVYEWFLDGEIKLTKVLHYTPQNYIPSVTDLLNTKTNILSKSRSAVKVFLDASSGLIVAGQSDGIYISSEKIYDLNRPANSFEDLVNRLIESATVYSGSPVLFKLADKSEGMGKVRGSLRLLHQKSLFNPMIDAVDFVRHKKGFTNVSIVVPFVRSENEFLQIKRELAVRKLMRKNSLQLWLELAVPENIINLENYLNAGLDGVVINLDELISHLNGFDTSQADLMFYKNEFSGLLKFLGESLKLLHKSKVRFIAYGTMSMYPQVLDFLVEKGVYGVVVERFEEHHAKDILNAVEKRIILKRSL